MKENLILLAFAFLTSLGAYSLVTSEKIDNELKKAQQFLTREIYR